MNPVEAVHAYDLGGAPLGPKLLRAATAQSAGLPEAAVFYCGRVLEALSAHALTLVNLQSTSNMFANLDELDRLSLLSRPITDLAHTLRRTSNRARHSMATFTPSDGAFALFCLEQTLLWFFADFPRGPKLSLEAADIGVRESSDAFAHDFVRCVNAVLVSNASAAPILEFGVARLSASAAIASIAADTLIATDNLTSAEQLLTAALANTPDDLRLNQLLALLYRRSNRPQEALAILKDLDAKNPDDEETIGIYAGALKRLWEQNNDEALLRLALKRYRAGWTASKARNAYLGVNAAAIMCWLKQDGAAALAAEIVKLFAQRRAKMVAANILGEGHRSYYDVVTEAEALLIAGDVERARKIYADAFARFSARTKDIEGSIVQANRTLATLGLPRLA